MNFSWPDWDNAISRALMLEMKQLLSLCPEGSTVYSFGKLAPCQPLSVPHAQTPPTSMLTVL